MRLGSELETAPRTPSPSCLSAVEIDSSTQTVTLSLWEGGGGAVQEGPS